MIYLLLHLLIFTIVASPCEGTGCASCEASPYCKRSQICARCILQDALTVHSPNVLCDCAVAAAEIEALRTGVPLADLLPSLQHARPQLRRPNPDEAHGIEEAEGAASLAELASQEGFPEERQHTALGLDDATLPDANIMSEQRELPLNSADIENIIVDQLDLYAEEMTLAYSVEFSDPFGYFMMGHPFTDAHVSTENRLVEDLHRRFQFIMNDIREAEEEGLRMALAEQSRVRLLMAPPRTTERRVPRRQANTGNNDLPTPPRHYSPIEDTECSFCL